MRDKDLTRFTLLKAERNTSTEDLALDLLSKSYLDQSLLPTARAYYDGIFDSAGATTSLQLLSVTEKAEVHIGYFDGNLMKFHKDLVTGEISTDVDCLAKTLGFMDAHDLLSRDETMDILLQSEKETGVWPVRTIDPGNANIN